ncbi:uncharacterized protein LOC144170153 [Haemaphysalis longicornis]
MKATDMQLKPCFIVLLAAISAGAYEVNNLRHGNLVGLRSNGFDFNPSAATAQQIIFSGPNALERMLSQSIGHSLEQGIITGSSGHRGLVQGIGHNFGPSAGHLISPTGLHGLQPVLSPGVGHGVALSGIQGFGQGFERNVGKSLQPAIVPTFTRQIPQGGGRGLSQGFTLGVPRTVGHAMAHKITHAKAPSSPRSNIGQAMFQTVGQAGSYGSSSSYGSSHGLVQSFQPNYGHQFASPFRRPVHDDFAFGESKVIHGPTYLVHTFGTGRDPYYGSQKSYSGKRQRGSKAYVRKAVMLKEKTRHRH